MGLGSAISTAVSGLRVNAVSVAVTANNVANLTTPGFIPDRVVASSVAAGADGTAGGVTASVRLAIPLAIASLDHSNVDVADEFTRLIQAKAAYAQGLDLIRTSDRMLRQSLDETT